MQGPLKGRVKLVCAIGCLTAVALLTGCVDGNNPSGPVSAIISAEPRQGQAPLEVTFDASGSYDNDGSISDYLWEFDDGTGVVAGKELVHTFSQPGQYSVILRVVGPSGVGGASTTVRVLNNPPVASFSFYPLDPFEDETVSFDGSDSSDPDGDEIVRWSWDFGDGNTGEGEFADHMYTQSGDYTVRLTVEDEEGEQASTSRTVTVDDCAGGRCGR
ncbi:MAG: PKD domain-containing protein [Candidatus Bipolaricaulota bacterium]